MATSPSVDDDALMNASKWAHGRPYQPRTPHSRRPPPFCTTSPLIYLSIADDLHEPHWLWKQRIFRAVSEWVQKSAARRTSEGNSMIQVERLHRGRTPLTMSLDRKYIGVLRQLLLKKWPWNINSWSFGWCVKSTEPSVLCNNHLCINALDLGGILP